MFYLLAIEYCLFGWLLDKYCAVDANKIICIFKVFLPKKDKYIQYTV